MLACAFQCWSVCRLQAFETQFKHFPAPRAGVVVHEKDHFWFNDEWILFTLIHRWLADQLEEKPDDPAAAGAQRKAAAPSSAL